MDDMLGTLLDMDDSVRAIMDWIAANGGWEKNALYVTADHDHYLTLADNFPAALAKLIIAGKSHNITPENNSNKNPWSAAIKAARHEDDSKSQVEHIKDFSTWSAEDIDEVGHFWGARGSGGNGWGSHSTRPVPVSYMGDNGCIEKLTGKGFRVLGREVAGTPGKIDQMHLHACMLNALFGLDTPVPTDDTGSESGEGAAGVIVQLGPRPYYLVRHMKDSDLKTKLRMYLLGRS